MYLIKKTLEVAGSHNLKLNYESKCQNIHGHNWIITVYCKAKQLNENGMVIDFTEIKKQISDKLDHKHLNDVLDFNPTAENMAKWICDSLNIKMGSSEKHTYCYKVEVIESLNNQATYIDDIHENL